MKRMAVLALVFLVLGSVVYAKDYEVTKKAGDLTVDVRIDRNPPVAGPITPIFKPFSARESSPCMRSLSKKASTPFALVNMIH